MKFNLFSLHAVMLKCTVTLDALGAHMLGESLYFVSRDTGHYVEATKVVEDPIAATVLVPGKMQLIDVNDLQVSLARSHGETLRETARQTGIKVVGGLVPCTRCSEAKGERTEVPWTTDCRLTKPLQIVPGPGGEDDPPRRRVARNT